MRRIPDKLGNEIIIGDKVEGSMPIQLKTSSSTLIIGEIDTDTKTFIVDIEQDPVILSAKFMSEAKTFDKVQVGQQTITLNSLLYLLNLPHGIQINSFGELVYIDCDFKFVQFKSRFEAMLYMCDRYEEYFNAHPDKLYPVVIGECTITDQDRFIEASLLTIRNLATLKKGGDPYFLQLAKYYTYLKKNEN